MKVISRHISLLLFTLTLLGLGPSIASAGDIPWSSLSAGEQRTLSKARDNWEQLSTERQQRLLSGARRWQEMDPQQRDQARERWQQREDKRDRR